MKTDGRNGTSLTYNPLNLPSTVIKTGSINITYVYDAIGRKLRKISGTNVTDYIDGIQYDNSAGGANAIDFIQTEEGRAYKRTDGTYSYYYDLADHLGNTRATFNKNTATSQAALIQANDYYPFGMTHATTAGTNNYLYNKKELQSELGQYDYGARFYDPVIGRWTTVDPLSEEFQNVSCYNYGLNNPIRFIDPNGMGPLDDFQLFKNGNIEIVKRTTDKTDKLYASDSNGNIDKGKSITLDKGVLENKGGGVIDTKTDGKVNLTYYQAQGEQATNFFEFAANNSNVEWGINKFSDGNNFVITSHTETAEYGGTEIMLDKALNLQSKILIESDHSYPGGIEYPSGRLPQGEKGSRGGDIAVSKWLDKKFPTHEIKYNIYTPSNGKYTRYTSDTFIPLLPEIIIRAPRKNKE